jgi:hypothetical protein
MTPMVGAFIEGVVQATILGGLFFLIGARRSLWLAAALLVVAGLLYVKFAVSAGRMDALPLEIAGTSLTLIVATAGMVRRSPPILAIGWMLHPVWDVTFHTRGLGSYAPDGYVIACIGFDVVLAAFIMLVAARSKARVAAAVA